MKDVSITHFSLSDSHRESVFLSCGPLKIPNESCFPPEWLLQDLEPYLEPYLWSAKNIESIFLKSDLSPFKFLF